MAGFNGQMAGFNGLPQMDGHMGMGMSSGVNGNMSSGVDGNMSSGVNGNMSSGVNGKILREKFCVQEHFFKMYQNIKKI